MNDDLKGSIRLALAADTAHTSDYDLNRDKGYLRRSSQLRTASVLVCVTSRHTVVLTKRASHLKHHPGQIAFPGGKMDPQDADATDTALREAEEEIGLSRTDVEILGFLPEHETVTGFNVFPALGFVKNVPKFTPQPGEVEEVFEVPFAFLSDPNRFRVEGRTWRGQRRYYYTVPYGPYYIWGATARILRGLADRLSHAAA